jgi:hypothetical protein
VAANEELIPITDASDPGRTLIATAATCTAQLSLDWVVAGADKLASAGADPVHTGMSIVDGQDVLCPPLEVAPAEAGCKLWYRELPPPTFGEELATPAYAKADRISAVGARVVRIDR